MKKLISITLILALLLPAFALAEDPPLSRNEKQFVGSWTMCATSSSGKQYVFIITFLDNLTVVQRSMVFKDGDLETDNKASGEWCGFTTDSIIFTLAGTDMTAKIKEDGYLYLYFFDDFTFTGIYSRCEDMTKKIGW